jgi:hypothetical protein
MGGRLDNFRKELFNSNELQTLTAVQEVVRKICKGNVETDESSPTSLHEAYQKKISKESQPERSRQTRENVTGGSK